MTSLNDWIAGARPRTLPAAIAPVLVGTALADWHQSLNMRLAVAALVVALALQIGVNYANDYSDGIRGTDETRVGPIRLVGQKLAAPQAVKTAAFTWFGVAAVAGLYLTLATAQWIFIPMGLAAIASAWFYTGGKNPYGYAGLGELFVFVWFGLAAVLGTVFVQVGAIAIVDIILAIGAGAFACALLVVNNLRDIPTDTDAGKRTLAVRLGDLRTRQLYVLLVFAGFGSSAVVAAAAVLLGETDFPLLAGLGVIASAVAHVPGRAVINGAHGRDLIPVLVGTGRAQLVWAVVTSIAVFAS